MIRFSFVPPLRHIKKKKKKGGPQDKNIKEILLPWI